MSKEDFIKKVWDVPKIKMRDHRDQVAVSRHPITGFKHAMTEAENLVMRRKSEKLEIKVWGLIW